ncbi:hypothetical protein [Domibacillus indicus]|uniref:hypothetical protein n=1 Tax=Domibacillus indicus TaxID=1437523 RepID=UPI000617E1F0|nr:hypothetical protein [Domibacillus indicus]
MEQKWKKRYSFRLKAGDDELYELLEGLADSKRSEAIRRMLLFACRTIAEEKQESDKHEAVWKELQAMREMAENHHQELLNQLAKEQITFTQKKDPVPRKENEKRLTEKALNDSAAAMMTSFGIID